MYKIKTYPIPYAFISLVIWLFFAVYDFRTVSSMRLNKIEVNFNRIESKIKSNDLRYQEILMLIESQFINHTSDQKIRQLINQSLNKNKVLGIYDTDAFEKLNYGSLTLLGDKKTLGPLKWEEIERAVSLTHLFQTTKKLLPHSPWVYYTSEDFCYIYPFVKSQIYHFKSNVTALQFYKNSLPENNPERKMFWTDPYVDEAGKGLMSTVSMPIYIKNKFQGSLSIDFMLTDLKALLTGFDYVQGEYQIVNSNGYILTSTEVNRLDANVLRQKYNLDFKFEAGKKIKVFPDETDLILFYKTSNFNRMIVYRTDFYAHYLAIVTDMSLSFFFGIVLLMFNLGILFYSQFQKKLYVDDIEKNKLMSLAEMSAGIAHEINNPLSVIRGRTDQLLRAVNNNTYDHDYLNISINRIGSSTDRIAKIVKALKNFSREGKNDPFVRVNLKSIIDDAFILCENKMRNNDAELKIDEILAVDLLCRPYQVVQILINLINNSFDAIENNDEKWIRIQFHVSNSKIQIRVIDSGRGISKDIVEKIFDPFFTNKDLHKGTGLGLSISKRIAIDHGGDLFYEMYNGHTSFVLILPNAI